MIINNQSFEEQRRSGMQGRNGIDWSKLMIGAKWHTDQIIIVRCSAAGKVLSDPHSTKREKSVAASALTQARNKKK